MAVTIIFWVMNISLSETCPPKWACKTRFYRNIWNAAVGQRRPWCHWNLLGVKVLIKHFKKSALALETMLCTRRNRRFFKPEISVIFGILAKGGLHEKLLESEILEMRRWSRCYNGKVAVTIISWVMSISISEICPPKWAWKSRFDRNIWNAAAGKRRPWRHWKLIGVKVPIKHFKRRFLAP